MQSTLSSEMEVLIKTIRSTIPFNLSFNGACVGRCDVCPQKLIEYLDIETSHWESRIKHGVAPLSYELETLAKDYQRILAILQDGDLIKSTCLPEGCI